MLEKTLSLRSMPLEDLWSLHEAISGVLSARIKAEKLELEKRLAMLDRSLDRTDPAARRRYPPVLPKYRNPQTSESWSGRGKHPRWLTAAVKSGHKIEEFRIQGIRGDEGPSESLTHAASST